MGDLRICPNCGEKRLVYHESGTFLREGKVTRHGAPSRRPPLLDMQTGASGFECLGCGFQARGSNELGDRCCRNCRSEAPWIFKTPFCRKDDKHVTFDTPGCDHWHNGESMSNNNEIVCPYRAGAEQRCAPMVTLVTSESIRIMSRDQELAELRARCERAAWGKMHQQCRRCCVGWNDEAQVYDCYCNVTGNIARILCRMENCELMKGEG